MHASKRLDYKWLGSDPDSTALLLGSKWCCQTYVWAVAGEVEIGGSMFSVEQPSAGRSDALLIQSAREGNHEAEAELYRRHKPVAVAVAYRHTDTPSEVEDIVSESFLKVFSLIRNGGGPNEFFRAYLLTAVSREAFSRNRSSSQQIATDDFSQFEAGDPFADEAMERIESGFVVRAYKSLPERWRAVLWHSEIEDLRPREIAPILGLTPNAVSALAVRAREGLREAYLAVHLNQEKRLSSTCAKVRDLIPSHIRGNASKRDERTIQAHLRTCSNCSTIYAELNDLGSKLKIFVLPLILGGITAQGVSAGGAISGGAATVALGKTSLGSAGVAGAGAGTAAGGSAGVGATGGVIATVAAVALTSVAVVASAVVFAPADESKNRTPGSDALGTSAPDLPQGGEVDAVGAPSHSDMQIEKVMLIAREDPANDEPVQEPVAPTASKVKAASDLSTVIPWESVLTVPQVIVPYGEVQKTHEPANPSATEKSDVEVTDSSKPSLSTEAVNDPSAEPTLADEASENALESSSEAPNPQPEESNSTHTESSNVVVEPSAGQSIEASQDPSAKASPSSAPSGSARPTANPSKKPIDSPDATDTPAEASGQPSTNVSETSVPSVSSVPTTSSSVLPTALEEPTDQPTDAPTESSVEPSPEETPSITVSPTVDATEEPAPSSLEESGSADPSVQPTEAPVTTSPEPTLSSSVLPTVDATEEPAPSSLEESGSADPSVQPTEAPVTTSPEPTTEPSSELSPSASPEPTLSSSVSPTVDATEEPEPSEQSTQSSDPSLAVVPSGEPSDQPTESPDATGQSSEEPSDEPSVTESPDPDPSIDSSAQPSDSATPVEPEATETPAVSGEPIVVTVRKVHAWRETVHLITMTPENDEEKYSVDVGLDPVAWGHVVVSGQCEVDRSGRKKMNLSCTGPSTIRVPMKKNDKLQHAWMQRIDRPKTRIEFTLNRF